MISLCEVKFFCNYNLTNQEQSKIIFGLLFHYIRYSAGIYRYRSEYIKSVQIYKRFENTAMYANSKNLMNYISWVDYNYTLSYLLYHTNEDFESMSRCLSITSDYFNKKIRIENLNRIFLEENKNPKSHSDKVSYLNYIYKFLNLAQVICNKTGAKDEISQIIFKQFNIREKLLFLGEDIYYKNKFVIDNFNFNFGGSKIYVFLDEKFNQNNFKKIIINIKRFFKASIYKVFRLIAGYGEKPFNLLPTSIVLVLTFSFIYSYIETTSFFNFLNYFYHSFFIFTSFGLNENLELNNSATKLWIVLEIAIGIIMIDGFIVLLAKKYLR